jgi:hypothetical protein
MSLNPRSILEIQKFYLFSCISFVISLPRMHEFTRISFVISLPRMHEFTRISFCHFFATNARIYTNFFCHFFATNARIYTNFFLSFLCHECTNLHEFLFVISFVISLSRMHKWPLISSCSFVSFFLNRPIRS